MRKPLLVVAAVVVTVALLLVAGAAVIRRDNAARVARAEALVHDLQTLQIGKSDSRAAAAIAAKFGNAPPRPEFGGAYNKENCAATKPLENCAYILAMNNNPLLAVGRNAIIRLQFNHPSMRFLRLGNWLGYTEITVKNDIVVGYLFWVWFRARNGQWRGVAGRESLELPRYERVEARVSDSYSVQIPNGIRGDFLQSSLTPAATNDGRRRALHFDFACLVQRSGCADICDVMPDAWRDFYERRGRLDVEKFGPARLLCSAPPK